MRTLNMYVILSSRSPGAFERDTWLVRHDLLCIFCVPSHLKTVKLAKLPIIRIEVLYLLQ